MQISSKNTETDLIETIANEYESMFYIDLYSGKMSIYRMDYRAYEKSRPAATSVLFSDYIELIILTNVHKDDQKDLLHFTTLDNVREMLSTKKSVSVRYRTCDTPVKYMELRIIKAGYTDTPESAVVCILDQTTLALREEESAKVKSELERIKDAQQYERFIRLIANDFDCVYYIDLANGSREIHYRIGKEFAEIIPNWNSMPNFRTRLNAFIDTVVVPEDRERVYYESSREVTLPLLKTKQAVFCNFRIAINGAIRYYQLKFTADIIDGDIHGVTVGFHDVDDSMRHELQKESELTEAKQIAEKAQQELSQTAISNSLAMGQALLTLQTDEALLDTRLFLEIVRERFSAQICCLSRFDFDAKKVYIDTGNIVLESNKTLPAALKSINFDVDQGIKFNAKSRRIRELSHLDLTRIRVAFGFNDGNVAKYKSASVLPVVVQNELIGELTIIFKEERHLSDDEKDYFQSLSSVLESAIERQRRYIDEKNRVAAETFKADVTSFVVNHRDHDEIIEHIGAKLLEFFNNDHIILQCTDGSRKDWLSKEQSQEAVDTSAECSAKSVLSRQIFIDEKLWGNLSVIDTKEQHHFTKTGERVLQMAADAVSLALQRANAMAEISRKNHELLLALDDAKRAERTKSTFLATMSHEIRTPLNAVIGFSEFLRAPDTSPSDRQDYLDGIAKSSNALLALINDILDLSKLESHSVDVKGGCCNLQKLFDEMKSIFHFTVHEKRLVFETRIANDLPLLNLREERVRQILLNLIGNAIKFTAEGKVQVTAGWDTKTNTLTISVKDTGIGITPEKLNSIFDPFVQDGSVRGSRVYQGTGLGLPISKRLAEAAGGQLSVKSVVGKGSTFTLEIPDIAVVNADDTQKPDPIIAQKNTADETLKVIIPADLKFILIDDVAINLRILKQHLKNAGVNENNFMLFTDAKQAISYLKNEAPEDISAHSIILTDMWMPEMNGESLARNIRKNTKLHNIPVVAVTADADADATFDVGLFNAILTKPVTEKSVKNLLKSFC